MSKQDTKIEKVDFPPLNKGNITPIQSDLPTVIPRVERVADFLKFAQWFATPRSLRDQKTQKEFAEVTGVNQDTLTDWKHNQCFWPIAQQFMSEWVKERIPDVINSLYLNICDKSELIKIEAFLSLGGMTINPENKKKITK